MTERDPIQRLIEDEQSTGNKVSLDQIFQWGKQALILSEQEPCSAYEEFFSDAPQPHYEAKSSSTGEPLKLTRDNTIVKEFPHYPEFDHVYHFPGGPTKYYIWRERQPQMYAQVLEQGFDKAVIVKPSEEDYRLWMDNHIRDALK